MKADLGTTTASISPNERTGKQTGNRYLQQRELSRDHVYKQQCHPI